MPKYKIPARRKVIKTVRMSNGSVLTGEVDARPGGSSKIYWFKNDKYITPYQQKRYKFYDRELKAYRGLADWNNDNATPVYQPALNYLGKKAYDYANKKQAEFNRQAFDSSPKNMLTLRTKKSNDKPGLMNLVDTPINLLDSVAINAGRSGTDFWTDMALLGKESTIGGYSKALTDKHFYNPNEPYHYNPHDLTNNHAFIVSPESDYLQSLDKDYDFNTDEGIAAAEKNAEYALKHGLVIEQTPHYSWNIMADAFKRYQMNPTKYNSRQKNYVPVLNGIRDELVNEQQLQNYWNARGKNWYAKGRSQGMAEGGYLNTSKQWNDLSLTEKSEIMKQAVANGITDLNEIRQTYNEYAEGGSMDNTVGEYADAIYQNATEEPYGDPSSHYNNVNEELLRTLKPDYRGHYSDDVKLPNHPSSPTRGRFNGRYFDLTDKGMDNPNYTLFGLIDNGDGNTIMRYNGADVLPEITATPNGNYYDDTYNNIRIRQKADGGNLFKGGGYIPSASIKRDIANFEGSSMKTNRSFEAEAKDFNRVIPLAIRNKLSQRQLDALYSYGYNVGMGNLKSRVLPTLTAYTQGRARADDVAASMWASKDPYMKGLQRRRAYERNMFTGNSPVGTQGSIVDRAINMDLSNLPTVAQFTGEIPKFQYDLFPPNPTNYGTPIDWSTPEKKAETPTITPKENNGLGLFALINQIYDSPKQEPLATYTPQKNNSMFVVNAPTSNDTFLDSSWFKEGGYLYDEGGNAPTIYKTSDGYTTASGHPIEQIGWDDNGYARFRDTVTGDLGHAFEPSDEYGVTEKMPSLIDMANNYARNYSLNQMMKDASVASSDNTYLAGSGKEQNPNLKYQGLQGAMANAAWEKEHPYLSKAGMAAGAVPFAVAAYPFAASAGEAAYPFVESAMQSSWFPYVDAGLTALGGADAANDIYNGNANAMTALEIAPMAQMYKPLTYSLKGAANTVKNLYDEGALWDRYTTLGGRFGNYSDNPFVNVYATAARRFGLPDKPRIPADAMRKLKFEDGEIIPVNNGEVTLTGGRTTAGKPHMNSSTDRQVTSHKFGWDGRDGYLFSTQDFVNQTLPSGSLKSIEPSDMFANGVNVSMPINKITLISGDKGALKAAKEAGIQTLSSPRLRRMYSSKWDEYQTNRFLNKKPKDIEFWQPYADEINRLMGTRGTPTLADYKLLEQKTGLNAGVAPISEYQRAIDSLNKMLNASIADVTNGAVKQYVYPNGRVVDWNKNRIEKELDLIKRAKYNNVFYDPATWAEYNWKMANGIKDD